MDGDVIGVGLLAADDAVPFGVIVVHDVLHQLFQLGPHLVEPRAVGAMAHFPVRLEHGPELAIHGWIARPADEHLPRSRQVEGEGGAVRDGPPRTDLVDQVGTAHALLQVGKELGHGHLVVPNMGAVHRAAAFQLTVEGAGAVTPLEAMEPSILIPDAGGRTNGGDRSGDRIQ